MKEALHSAKLRCSDYQELDDTIVETISEVKIRKLVSPA